MRFFVLFFLAYLAAITVSATGSSKRTRDEDPNVPAPSSPEIRPYDGHYTLTLRPSNLRDEYMARLQAHIRDAWNMPHVRVQRLEPYELSPEQLRTNLNYDPSLRRYLYLHHSFWSFPDMVLATPIHREVRQPEGDHIWVLLSAHQPPFRGAPPLMRSHGYYTVSNGEAVVNRLARIEGPNDQALERGQVLTIEEVFRELRLLRLPNWEPEVPPMRPL